MVIVFGVLGAAFILSLSAEGKFHYSKVFTLDHCFLLSGPSRRLAVAANCLF